MKRHNKELEILRGFALYAVVGIHTFSIGLLNTEIGTYGNWFYQTLHTLLQFAVPCFIFLSALLISYTLEDKPFRPLNFYYKKFLHIFIPYVLWTVIYLIPQIAVGRIPFYKLFSFNSWFYWLTRGKAYEHLYFMSVILQLYLIAPLLVYGMRWLIKRSKKWHFITVLSLAVIGQLAVYYLNKYVIFKFFTSPATMVIWYFSIIIIGLWAGFYYEQFLQFLSKHRILTLVLGLLTTSAYLYFMILRILGQRYNTASAQFAWYGYVLIASCILLLVSRWLSKYHFSFLIRWIGVYSFGIYLIHPILTFILRHILLVTNPLLLLVILLAAQIIIICCCGYATKLCLAFKWSAVLFGDFSKWQQKTLTTIPLQGHTEITESP